jgi:release factor H-coupled RctB family protein
VIYPHLIGGDIGCGMTLFKTGLTQRNIKLDEWANLRFDLEHPWDEFAGDFVAEQNLEPTEFDAELGTIVAGNHFAELQAVHKIVDALEFKRIHIAKDQLVLLVHSGSRGIGPSGLQGLEYLDGIPADSVAAQVYLRSQNKAVRWARANRILIARRFVMALGAECGLVWDGCHNSITTQEVDGETFWVHRKGAVVCDAPFVVIPGSRGSFSYLLKVTGDGEGHAWSLVHGAGRKWSRSEARARMRERFAAAELVQTPLGGRVVCEERDSLYEEAPGAYKNIETVIESLVSAGLVSVIATFRPLLTYKARKLRR